MKKSKRLAIILKHRELVKQGRFEVAWHLLRLLVRGRVVLGYSDSQHEAETICSKLGCLICYPSPHYYAEVHDYGR